MKRIAAAKFKEQCLSILDDVDPDGLIITKHGKPVARLLPIFAEMGTMVGKFSGKIKIKGKIFSTGEVWDAES